MATGLKINNFVDTLLHVSTKNLVWWFNALRGLPDAELTRALDAFWAGQIDSKTWLVNTLNSYAEAGSNVYIFGGWIGVLGNLISGCSTWNPGKIRSIDLDPWCEAIADKLNYHWHTDEWRFKAVTADMGHYNYDPDIWPNIVINTSTEHISQETYDCWFDRVPSGSLIVLQGNNFFSCPEHVRCSSGLNDFKRMNYVSNTLYESVLEHDIYDRYMCIFKK